MWLFRELASALDPAWGTQGLCDSAPQCPGSKEDTVFPRRGRCSPFDETVVVLEIKGQQLHIITKLLHAVQGRRKGWLRLGHLGPEPAYRGHGAAS